MSLFTELDFIEANSRADKAIEALEDANGYDWKAESDRHFKSFLLSRLDNTFRCEEFREWAEKFTDLRKPTSERAYAGVITRAKGLGLIEHVGYAKTSNILAHGTPAGLWKRVKK